MESKVRMVWALMALAFASLTQSSAFASTGNNHPFRSTFGLVTKFSQGQPLHHLRLLKELKVSWVRDFVLWSDIEPKAGRYEDWPADFAKRLEYYKEHDIGIIYVLAYANGKAYPNTETNPHASIDAEALGRYATYIAKKLRSSGVRFAIEVWNEPHNFQILQMVGGKWNGAPPSPWVTHYVRMLNQVQHNLMKIDPEIPVLSSEDVWVNHYRFAEHHALNRSFRHVGLHPYTNDTSTGPEVAAATQNADWARPFTLVDADRSFHSAIARLREFTSQSTGNQAQVWITEWGWRVDAKAPHGRLSAEDVAAYLPRAFILASESDSVVLCWFSMYDSVDGSYGLLNNHSHVRSAYQAYKTMADLIGDAFFVGKISRNTSRVSGLQAFNFKLGSKRIAVIWTADNTKTEVELPNVWKVLSTTTYTGLPATTPSRPLYTVVASKAPLYIVYEASDSAECTHTKDLECK